MNNNYFRFCLWCLLALSLGGCSTKTVTTTQREEIIIETETIPEELLLDVGISPFDPGIDKLSEEEAGLYRQIREAEARYMPVRLMETLQGSGQWGVIRVIPNKQSEMDVWVDAKILESDGANLALQVTVRDSSNKKWYTKKYTEVVNNYAYDAGPGGAQEPFQGLYNKIANDLIKYRKRFTADDLKNLRAISELQFARRFAPTAFSRHLDTGRNGRISINSLPADNDPIMQRVRRIRQRDNAFVDTLQEYYNAFSRQMAGSYQEWRRLSYEEQRALDKLNRQKWTRGLLGAAAIIAGVLAQTSGSEATQTAGTLGIGAGLLGLTSAYGKSEEAKIHQLALEELGQSLNADVQPHTMQLEDRTVTLSGSVNEQYVQWHQILHEIYQKETGYLDDTLATERQ